MVTWAALREDCASLSLFAARQVVLVRGLLVAWTGKGEGGGSAKQSSGRPSPADFAKFVAELPATTELVLHEGDLSAANRYVKELVALPAGSVDVQHFALPKDAGEREAWAAQRIGEMVERRGGSIDGRAGRLLAQRCAGDLLSASQDVDKLLAYTSPLNSIFIQDVEALVKDSVEANAFALVDAICAKSARRTADLGDKLLEEQAPEQILALVGSRVHDLAMLAAARQERIAPEEVARQRAWPVWRLRQLERSLPAYTAGELGDAQSILVAADLALKTRPSHERPLVALLTLLALAQRSDPEQLRVAFAY